MVLQIGEDVYYTWCPFWGSEGKEGGQRDRVVASLDGWGINLNSIEWEF